MFVFDKRLVNMSINPFFALSLVFGDTMFDSEKFSAVRTQNHQTDKSVRRVPPTVMIAF